MKYQIIMKQIKYYLQRSIFAVILLLIAAGIMLTVSCDKNEPGTPEITNVRPIDPEQADVSLSYSILGSWLVIQGSGFSTLSKVYFNDYEAYFKPALVTDNNIVIMVPDETPTAATYPDSLITNTIEVVTLYGSDTYDFSIYTPPPVFQSISNEFANAGDTITLGGKYFYFIDTVYFPGNITSPYIKTGTSGTWCDVEVPEGVTEAGDIIVISKAGSATLSGRTKFNDTTGMLIDFEDPTIQDNPDGAKFGDNNDNPFIPSCRGNYMYTFVIGINPGTYWLLPTVLETHATYSLEWPDYPGNTPINSLELRFEAYVYSVWNSGFYEFGVSDWQYRYFWQPWGTMDDRTDFTTEWHTFVVALSEFSVDGSGEVTPLTYGELKGGMFNMNFKNQSPEAGGLFIPMLNMAFDNFRIILTD